MPKNFIAIVVVVFAFLFADSVASACTIKEIVAMVKSGSGNKIVDEKCDSEVDDAPTCSFDEVLKLARAKKSRFDIEERCGLCDMPTCDTGGYTCSITMNAAKGKSGAACWCPTNFGPRQGRAICN